MKFLKNKKAASNLTLIMIMFGVVLTCIAILSIAAFYGESDWNWIANVVARLTLLFMVLALALYTLFGWLRN